MKRFHLSSLAVPLRRPPIGKIDSLRLGRTTQQKTEFRQAKKKSLDCSCPEENN